MYHYVTLFVAYCYVSYLYIELVKADLWKNRYVEKSLLWMMTFLY